MAVLNNRLFVGSYYDPNESLYLYDEVRYSPVTGTPCLDSLPTDRLNFEWPVATGDPQTVKGLVGQDNWLYVFKNGSIHALYIDAYPESWTYHQISSRDGLYAPDSLVRLLNGAIAFADVDDYKMLQNQRVVNLTSTWHDSYFTLSGKATIVSWYDKIDGSLRFTNGVDTSSRFVYVLYVGKSDTPLYKLQLPANQYVEFVCVSRDGSVYTTNQYATFQGVFKWSKTAYTYGAGNIIPYLKTNEMIADETMLMVIDRLMFVKSGNGATGTLTNDIYIDGTLYDSGTGISFVQATGDQAKTHLVKKMPTTAKRACRKVQIAYNTTAAGEAFTTGRMRLDEIVVYGRLTVPTSRV